MRGLKTVHVMSGRMRGLNKLRLMTHTDGHGNSMTESAQWDRFSKSIKNLTFVLKICVHKSVNNSQ